MSQGAADHQSRVAEDVQHQDWSPSKAIGQPAEKQRPHGSKCQRKKYRLGHFSRLAVKLSRDCRETKDQEKVVEGVQRPSQKTRNEGVSLLPG